MENNLFQYFCEQTKGFVFSTRQDNISRMITGSPHTRLVKALFSEIRRMAIKKYFKLPEYFAAYYDRDDWIQLAMITAFECLENYDHKRPFDNYVRFMVSKRLADKQRTLLRKNPPADREILALYQELKKNGNTEQAIAKLAEDTGKSIEHLREIVHSGVGPRIFTHERLNDDDGKGGTEIPAQEPTPEVNAEYNELRRLLLVCMEKLSKKARLLFQQHELEEISFKKLFQQANFEKSFASFKRWYKKEIYDKVKNCVISLSRDTLKM